MAKTKTSKSTVTPLGDRVLVKRLAADDKTAGGIILPDTAKEKPKEGIVLALGDGRTLEDGTKSSFSVSVGDRVLFTSYAGTDVKYAGEDYMIMREDDLLAIID